MQLKRLSRQENNNCAPVFTLNLIKTNLKKYLAIVDYLGLLGVHGAQSQPIGIVLDS